MTKSQYKLPEMEVRLKLAEGRVLYSPVPLNSPEKAVETMASLLREYDHEVACIVNLDIKLRPINFSFVGVGNSNQCMVPVASICKAALLSGASYTLLLHNHPSGDVTPSPEDLETTRRLIAACHLIETPLTDHIIVGGYSGEWYSIRTSCPEIDFNAAPTIFPDPKPEPVRHRRKSR